MPDHDHAHHGHHGGQHHNHLFASPEAAAFAELEGEVLLPLTSEAIARISEHEQRGVRRVLDVGCGPGVGSCRLAQQFGAAHVVAADSSAAMLEQANARAARLGLADRIETRRVELPDDLGALGRADVVWASMVVHHVGDEADVLRRIRELLVPGGLLAVVEFAANPVVVPDAVERRRPGIRERLDAAWSAWFASMRSGLPGVKPSGAYPAMLAAAGFDVVVDDVLVLDREPPLDERARQFVERYLERAHERLAPYADAHDLDALSADNDDASLHVARQLYLARAV